MLYKILFYSVFAFYLIAFSWVLIKNKALFQGFFFNAVSGTFALIFLKLTEQFLMFKVYINLVTVISAIVIGPVGVLLNIIIDYIFLK